MQAHILVVEDDAEIREGVAIYLKNQGYTVHKAANGKEGLEVLEQQNISLAIVDVMMPVMDGITMVLKLREKYDFPVIMLSAKSEDIDKITGLNMGADDYVTKPFVPMELLARVARGFWPWPAASRHGRARRAIVWAGWSFVKRRPASRWTACR